MLMTPPRQHPERLRFTPIIDLIERPPPPVPSCPPHVRLPAQGLHYTVVVDGCNVAYYRQNKEGGQFQIAQVRPGGSIGRTHPRVCLNDEEVWFVASLHRALFMG